MIKPMLAKKAPDGIPEGDYMFEIKWDGLRALIEVRDHEIRLYSRSGKDITAQYPELQTLDAFSLDNCVFDSEIVCFNTEGRPSFRTVVGRRHNEDDTDRATRAKEAPATCIIFDVLEANGRDTTREPWHVRHQALELLVRENGRYAISRAFSDGNRLYNEVKERRWEGIMAKRRGAIYHPGKRSDAWLKVKVQYFMDVQIVGFTEGEGRRSDWFGALIIKDMDGNDLGRVGTGFSDQMLEDLRTLFDKIGWANGKLQQPLIAEVKYMQQTKSGHLREPVFMKLRSDLLED